MGSNPIIPTFLDTKNVIFSRPDISRNITIPNKLTPLLAEDIGIQIGDGGVYIYKDPDGDSHYRIECYGHIIEDENYLNNFVKPLKESLFNLNLKLKHHELAGTCYLKIGSKALVSFYHNVIGLPIGKKSEIFIPQIILNSSDEVISACLRGLCDTDFSLTFKKKNKNFHNYPVLHLDCNSKALVQQLESIISKKFEIPVSATYHYQQYDKRTKKIYIKHHLFISGSKNLEKWIEQIGFNNPVHITKYLILDKFGFCPPKITLEQRIKILNGRLNPESFEK